jgi:Protein of unknown function (DUF3631)
VTVLLDDVAAFYRRFVVVTGEQADTLALFTAHTHSFEVAETTPYVGASSAEKRSGKTRLLETAELVVREPLPTMNISDAALFRAIADCTPTLLLDEVDAIFSPKARDREDLRGMINAGYRQGAFVFRMGGANMRTLERFPVFCPKMFALIGELPDTISDRTIPMRLQRRTRDEQIERFRRRDVEPEGHGLRERLADWLEPQLDYLSGQRPDLPDELDDRAQDCWEPLLAIADLAGGDWPVRARHAALALSTGEAREDESVRARLLADIEAVFSSNGTQRYRTADLIAELAKIEESPWGDWYGKTISPQGRQQIERGIAWVQGRLGLSLDPERWPDPLDPTEPRSSLYQTANRIAYTVWLRSQGVDAWLCHLLYVEDKLHRPTSRSAWEQGLARADRELGIDGLEAAVRRPRLA